METCVENVVSLFTPLQLIMHDIQDCSRSLVLTFHLFVGCTCAILTDLLQLSKSQ
eukprot:m.260343 g.260343  ORF g.260343 m.260343 type:complete len:55 (+) comp15558_c0_seq2:2257-2421(+)